MECTGSSMPPADYRGPGLTPPKILSQTGASRTPTIKREFGGRNVIEPVIGHTKRDGLLERNTPGTCPLCLCPDRELEIATRKRRAARAERYCAQ